MWPEKKTDYLIAVMDQVRGEIKHGALNPGAYLRHATKLFNARFEEESHHSVQQKWSRLCTGGHAVPVVSQNRKPIPVFQGPPPPCITTIGKWSEAEVNIYVQVMLGENGLMLSPTIPRNVYELAASACMHRGVKVGVDEHPYQL